MNTTAHQSLIVKGGWTYRDPLEVPSFSFENVDVLWWQQLAANNWEWAVYAGLLYTVATFLFQRLMKNKAAMHLKMPLFLWNFTFGMVYMMAVVRIGPGFLKRLLQPNGVYHSVCTRKGMDIPTEFWTVVFILAKFVEFGDTAFSVLKKRPFHLTWSHHLVSMAQCWIMAPAAEPFMVVWMVVNYSVHSIIYTYLAFRTIGYRFPKIFGHVLNAAECSQFVFILMVILTAVYYKQIGAECSISVESIKISVLCGVVFLFLYGNAFYQSLFAEKKPRSSGIGNVKLMRDGSEMDVNLEEKKKD